MRKASPFTLEKTNVKEGQSVFFVTARFAAICFFVVALNAGFVSRAIAGEVVSASHSSTSSAPASTDSGVGLMEQAQHQLEMREWRLARQTLLQLMGIYDRSPAGSAIYPLIILNGIDRSLAEEGLHKERRPFLDRAANLASDLQEVPGSLELMIHLNAQGAVRTELKEYDGARDYLVKSLAMAHRLGSAVAQIDAARITRNLGVAEMKLELPQAQLTLERALGLFDSIGKTADAERVMVLSDLTQLNLSANRPKEALPYWLRVRQLREIASGTSSIATLDAMIWESEIRWRAEDYSGSKKAAEDALKLAMRADGPNSLNAAISSWFVGRAYALDNPAAAIPYLEQHLEIFKALNNEEQNRMARLTLSAWDELTGAHYLLGQHSQALQAAEGGLLLAKRIYGEDSADYAVARAGNGVVSLALGDIHNASRSFDFCIDRLGVGDPIFPRELFACTLNSGRVLTLLGDEHAAQLMFRRALQLIERGAPFVFMDEISARTQLAASERRIGELDAAEMTLLIVLNGIEGADLEENNERRWKFYSEFSRIEAARGKNESAILFGKLAVEAIQSLRQTAKNSLVDATAAVTLDASYLWNKRIVYDELANLLLSEGRIEEAQVVLQMLKEQELSEAFERSAKTDPRTTGIELSGLERKTFAEFYELRERQAALGQEKRQLAAKDKDGSISNAERARLKEIDTKLVPQIQAGVERFMAGLQERLHQQRKSGEKVRDLEVTEARLRKAVIDLDKKDPEAKAVALQFVTTDDTVSILLTTPGVPPIVRQVPMQRKALNDLISQVKMRLQGRADRALLDPQLRQLYALLIAPVEADLKTAGARTLMLSPNGVLRYVPFAALLNGQRFLVQDYTLALYTEGVASLSFETTVKRDWRLAGLGLTQEVKGARGEMLSALPNVKEELSGVLHQPRVTGQAWLDADFDRNRLGSTLRGNFNVLHVASHFEFISGRPDASSLYLGDKSSLSLAEVVLQDMRFDNFDLVNFSACETAVGGGKDEYGQELESLGAKVLQQGAGAVMATLWKVADKSTPRLMQAFYKARGDSALNKAQALRQAQLAFISGDIRLTQEKIWDHPYYWAPFVLMGNWR